MEELCTYLKSNGKNTGGKRLKMPQKIKKKIDHLVFSEMA